MTQQKIEIEVCLGRIEGTRVNCYKVPQPRTKMQVATHWMTMTCQLSRRPGSNQIINVADPFGADFGTIDARVAKPLCQLMDGARVTRLRLVARLDSRKKEPFEYPGQPISAQHGITINIYALSKYVTGIGKFLSQNQVWLRDPYVMDRGSTLMNPHAPKDHAPSKRFGPSTSMRGGGIPTATRTLEEVRKDVFKVFDTITETKDLPEMEAPAPVITPLLPHQKQALYFVNMREGLPTYKSAGDTVLIDDDEGEDEAKSDDPSTKDQDPIWQRKTRRDGKHFWRNAITGHEAIEQPRPLLGGILADVMGLGKTLNILSLVVGSLTRAREYGRQEVEDDEDTAIYRSRATLLICPLSTIVNWKEQINQHLRDKAIKHVIYQGSNRTNDAETLAKNDLVITTYQVVANEYARTYENRPNKPIFEINWFRVVLDEAHQIRNGAAIQSKAACEIRAERRWCVTGTPVQNRLEDLGALIKFLHISPFDELGNFGTYISTPLRTGDAEAIPKLRILVDSITLRRLKDKLNLPQRKEQIVKLTMTQAERNLYDSFNRDTNTKLNAMAGEKQKLGGKSYAQVLKAISRLRMLAAHKEDMLNEDDWQVAKGFDSTNAVDLENDDENRPEKSQSELFEMYRLMRDANVATCHVCNTPIEPAESADDLEPDDEDIFGYMTPCNQMFCSKVHLREWKMNMDKIAGKDNRANCVICDAYIRNTYDELHLRAWLSSEATQGIIQKSKFARNLQRYEKPHTKTNVLLADLARQQQWTEANPEEKPIKSVVFSEWTTHLDLIQLAFTNHKVRYTRLDGSMSFSKRQEALTTFGESAEVNVILVSLKAGGLGLNLTAASRVFVMEPNYNPAAEMQAIERVHRLGQKRDVVIRRYVMQNSIEEKIIQLQERKVQLATFSVDRDSITEGKTGQDRSEKMRQTLEDLRSLLR